MEDTRPRKGWEPRHRPVVGPREGSNGQRSENEKLIEDCQRDIAEYVAPDSGILKHQLFQRLITRANDRQAKEALEMTGGVMAG
ncbi:hypothetical protein [Sinorhizobium psoraleae]|uniref:Uncharacterized protein n=1 Tax=Sinorhizobium psoraleae TaxID=520838 RepID=A0ABT4KN46_9HYPH|nr:hypothetical protein [Sinorhizobium psoraleae]MCZ4093392.1 hypothetical protein [Sinorhizobium psoraleae]